MNAIHVEVDPLIFFVISIFHHSSSFDELVRGDEVVVIILGLQKYGVTHTVQHEINVADLPGPDHGLRPDSHKTEPTKDCFHH